MANATPIWGEQRALIQDLYHKDYIKIGETTFKSGFSSPLYIDLRAICSDPKMTRRVANAYYDRIEGSKGSKILLSGVPMGSLHLTSAIGTIFELGVVVPRVKPKAYGLKKMVEGKFEPGDKVVVIEDIVTTAQSAMTVVDVLKSEGLDVVQVLCFCNYFNVPGISAIFTLEEILRVVAGETSEPEAFYARMTARFKNVQ
jgi:orotate phosphoribosyltransferase